MVTKPTRGLVDWDDELNAALDQLEADRIAADSAHAGAGDPHGDRAYVDAQIATKRGQANGLAGLDATAKVPTSQLPDGTSHSHDSIYLKQTDASATYVQFVSSLTGESAATATTRLNAALAAAAPYGVRKTVKLFGDFDINDSLVVYSRTTLDARDATVTLDPSVNKNILKNVAVDTPVRTLADAAMTAASATLTSATGAFTAADVGRSVVVLGANVGGLQLATTISAVANASTVTLALPAGTTVSAATATIRDRNSDITILGGLWTKFTTLGVAPPAGSRGTNAHAIFLRHLDRVLLRDVQVQTRDNGRYAITIGDVTAFSVLSPHFPTAKSDGVHITGPASNGTIRDVSGFTGDDMTALCTTENGFYTDTAGAITDVLVDSSRKYGAATVGNAFKLAGYPGLRHDRITARDLYVENVNAVALALAIDTGGLDVGSLRVDGVNGAAYLTGGTIDNLEVRNVRHDGTVASQPWLNVQGSAAVTRLSLTGLRCDSTATGQFPIIVQGSATVAHLTLRDVDWKASNTYLVQVKNTGGITTLIIADALLDSVNGGGFVDQQSTAALGTVKLSNVTGLNNAWAIAVEGTATTSVFCDGVVSKGAFYLGGTANVTVRGTASFTTSTPTITAGGLLRMRSASMETDVTNLAKNLGDAAYNTNGALGCGVGPVVCFATGAAPNWRSLRDAALTY